ncbi:hypothetical protein [Bifidobacterium tibiigranuli]|jgi:nitrite reductase (NO-forming)|uniref:hypothetical protein n=1 Tax=Bifidobacterium tibiigranuli TaxID=2172043 RepID=UPI0026EA22B9|nr:hypothetical protein [Bifidobacterium tibiigranuli]MCI1649475.1 hypothetical protein [Bifidobacterium tibiigranuli]MCI2186163.1 hypothetical protein [Bifidobacterium tibiigranuli]MCI2204010.1 hypothetical protein [Bifidobacterium tibiigranuli]
MPWRLALLICAGVTLLTGLDAALLRVGLAAPVAGVGLADAHGPLMIYGFLGTVIALERAVALRSVVRHSWWGYIAPVAGALGAVLLIVGILLPGATQSMPLLASISLADSPRILASAAWCAAMIALTTMYAVMLRAQFAPALVVQLLASLAGLCGMALWARGLTIAQIFPWWMALLVMTICGERLDLARLSLGAGAERRILAESTVLFIALPVTLLSPTIGYPLLGAALLVMIGDLATHDIARHTICSKGATRFMAACMLAGYAWASAAAVAWILVGAPGANGYLYDLCVHAITIGFVLSMVIAHAPIIMPAIVHRPLPYHPALWAVWGLLQAGLLIRIIAGFRQSVTAWRFGDMLDVVAVLAMMVTLVTLVVFGGRKRGNVAAQRLRSTDAGRFRSVGTGNKRADDTDGKDLNITANANDMPLHMSSAKQAHDADTKSYSTDMKANDGFVQTQGTAE